MSLLFLCLLRNTTTCRLTGLLSKYASFMNNKGNPVKFKVTQVNCRAHLGCVLLGLIRNIGIVGIRKTIVRSRAILSFQSGCKTFIVTLLTGFDMSVINSGPKRKDYSDHSSYSYSGIGPKERAIS